jgi:hypothetical protein
MSEGENVWRVDSPAFDERGKQISERLFFKTKVH